MLKPLSVWIATSYGKVFKRWEYQTTYLPFEKPVCGLRSNSENRTWKKDWFKLWIGVHHGCILSPCSFNLHAEYIMQNARLGESRVRIKLAGRNINTPDMQMASL